LREEDKEEDDARKWDTIPEDDDDDVKGREGDARVSGPRLVQRPDVEGDAAAAAADREARHWATSRALATARADNKGLPVPVLSSFVFGLFVLVVVVVVVIFPLP